MAVERDELRSVLGEGYAARGLEWQLATVGAVADEAPGRVSIDDVERALLESYELRYELIETGLEPFRQLATSTRHGSGGTGLGLPLTKALAEANRASFAIRSQKDAGTLVEVVFGGV